MKNENTFMQQIANIIKQQITNKIFFHFFLNTNKMKTKKKQKKQKKNSGQLKINRPRGQLRNNCPHFIWENFPHIRLGTQEYIAGAL